MNQDSVDQAKLSRELASAVEEDARRKAVDDMKKRSVLTARSYDEFRHLVACANDGQKPVSSREMEFLGKPGKREGYMYAQQRRGALKVSGSASLALLEKLQATVAPPASSSAAKVAEVPSTPTTMQEFERFWRRTDLDDPTRCTVLLALKEPHKFFRIELNDLGGILRVLSTSNDRHERVLGLLDSIRQVSQFKLAQQFLDPKDKEVARELFVKLGSSLEGNNNMLEEVRSSYLA
mmetsp:Transcript_14190/g.25390  ORF Transcript_14190/g.25390 Transcript_14190/m.25390 type:complete len:236 (+) Transcript_14190:146-853(+)